jgi:hypothetical protein
MLGCFRATVADMYVFCTKSDDGSMLYIDKDLDGLQESNDLVRANI